MGAFAGSAMLLAAIGLYGVIAYAVGQRTREIGIRLALGANRGEVLRMVMSDAGRLAAAGVVAGLAASVIATRSLQAQLFEVTPTDGATYALVGVGIAGGLTRRQLDSRETGGEDRSDHGAEARLEFQSSVPGFQSSRVPGSRSSSCAGD